MNKRDDIRLLANLLAQQKGDTPELRKQMKRHYVLSLGRYLKEEPFGKSFRIIEPSDWNDDRCVERYEFFCDPTDTVEDIEKEFWEDYGVRIYSPWDCTGQWFTARVHAVKISPTKVIVLHYMDMDI